MTIQVSKAPHVLGLSSKKFRSIAWGNVAVAITIFTVASLFTLPYYEAHNTTEVSTREYEATSRKQSEILRTLDVSTMTIFTRAYCTTTHCTTIKCSVIPANLNPGKVAGDYIESVFKKDCALIKSITLIFHYCPFPGNVLQKNWLETDVSIDQLSFESCSLSQIDDEAFALGIYEETRKIAIANNKVASLSRATFRYFKNLQELMVRENTIRQAEFDLLKDVSETLEILQLDAAIDDPKVLRNITGGSLLSKVQILSLRDNSIPIIDHEMFAGLPKIQSLYIERSEVNFVLPYAFRSIEKSLVLLTMNDNAISTLPEGLFDSMLQQHETFTLTIDNNPWHCDCNLKWMQELIRYHPTVVNRVPICKTPNRNALLTFSRATFCNETSPATNAEGTTTEKYLTTGTKKPKTTPEDDHTKKPLHPLANTCESLLDDTQLRISISGPRTILWSKCPCFGISELANGSIFVSVYRPTHQGTLLWYDSDFSLESSDNINCVSNVTRSHTITEVRPQKTYTICILGNLESDVSSLSCLGLTTRPDYEDRIWLSIGDKDVVLSCSIAILVVLCLLSALIVYLLVRRYPTLLRGSKRVMIVKRRNLDTIVLPRGVQVGEGDSSRRNEDQEDSKGSKEDGYVTPLPPVRPLVRQDSRVSRMSLQSDGLSYVSGIEPTLAQLASWRAMETYRVNVPPSPPHRPNKTRSLTAKISEKKSSVRAGRVCTM
ncbi:hypothetical protein KM043_012655 [Ampulex compressa]|nr:hypothetical protein KM043_012655 [Ampulex compressa]